MKLFSYIDILLINVVWGGLAKLFASLIPIDKQTIFSQYLRTFVSFVIPEYMSFCLCGFKFYRVCRNKSCSCVCMCYPPIPLSPIHRPENKFDRLKNPLLYFFYKKRPWKSYKREKAWAPCPSLTRPRAITRMNIIELL